MHIRSSSGSFVAVPLLLAAAASLLTARQAVTQPLESGQKERIVTINSSSKTSSTDGTGISFHRLLNRSGVVHAVILNERPQRQPISLRVLELSAASYDVYMDGSLLGTRTQDQLKSGLSITLPAVQLADDRPIIQQLVDGSDALIKEFQAKRDFGLGNAILANVRSWSQTAIGRIRNSGGVYLIISPTGAAFSSPLSWSRPTSDLDNTTAKYWKAIQDQREIIYTSIKDEALRSRLISAITPVDLTARMISDGKPLKIECLLTNRSEATLSGSLALGSSPLPSAPAAVDVVDLKRGGTFRSTFTPRETDAAPEPLTVLLQMKVGNAQFTKSATVDQAASQPAETSEKPDPACIAKPGNNT